MSDNPNARDNLVFSLAGVHRALPPLTSDQEKQFLAAPVEANNHIDKEKVQAAALGLPHDLRLGREIHTGFMPGFEDTPWQLLIGIDCVQARREKKLIVMDYDVVLTTLDRLGYGCWFAGDWDTLSNIHTQVIGHFPLSELLKSWNPSDYYEDEPAVRKCSLIRWDKRARPIFKRYGNLLGRRLRISERGEEPILVTGIAADVFPKKPWIVNAMAHHMVEGHADPFAVMVEDLRPPAPANALAVSAEQLRKIGGIT